MSLVNLGKFAGLVLARAHALRHPVPLPLPSEMQTSGGIERSSLRYRMTKLLLVLSTLSCRYVCTAASTAFKEVLSRWDILSTNVYHLRPIPHELWLSPPMRQGCRQWRINRTPVHAHLLISCVCGNVYVCMAIIPMLDLIVCNLFRLNTQLLENFSRALAGASALNIN